MRFFFFLFTAAFLSVCTIAGAQDNIWTLQRCVQYAIDHNISIQQDVLNKRLAEYTVLQSQLAQLPNASATPSYGKSFGRSINPTTNEFVDGNYDFLSMSGSANVLLFGWFYQRNLIGKNKFSLDASKADLDQLKDDVSLNVATGFLRAILAKEQIHVSEKQVELSKAQLDQTKSFASSGRLPELNVAQLESQLATDSSNLISRIADYTASILDLKTILNLDFEAPFDLVVPDIELTNQMTVLTVTPDQVYEQAVKYFGSIKAGKYRVKAAEKGLASNKSYLYPQLSFSYQVGTNWASNYYTYTQGPLQGYQVVADTSRSLLYQPVYGLNSSKIPLGDQLNNNFRQTFSVNLNVPIFNAWQSQYNVRQSRINLSKSQLDEYNAELTLKQNVYKAHNDARNSIEKYYAAKRAADAAQTALDFAKKRYDLGLTSTVDFLVTQNTEYTATSSLVQAKYDLIFKMKVIDYYLGKELKL